MDANAQARVRHYPARFVLTKIGLFLVAIVPWFVLGRLQQREIAGPWLTGTGLVVSVVALVTLFCYGAVPQLRCSHCRQRMRRQRLMGRQHWCLVCRGCKTYVDLRVGSD